MTAADQIAELERQRAERHRLLDVEYDERIRRITSANIGKDGHCGECGAALSQDEVEFYGHTCNACEARLMESMQ